MKLGHVLTVLGVITALLTIGATMGFERPWPDRAETELVAADHWCFRVYTARSERYRLMEIAAGYQRRGQRVPAHVQKRIVELNAAIAYYLRKARRPC